MSRAGRVFFLSVYPDSQAGTRLRAVQFFDVLSEAGLRPRLWTLLSSGSAERLLRGQSKIALPQILTSCSFRLVALFWLLLRLRRHDVVVVLREILPLGTTCVERVVARRACLVWDVDDSVWIPHEGLIVRGPFKKVRGGAAKYEVLAGLAEDVWAGSETLADWCRRRARNVWVLPTTVPLPDTTAPLSDRAGCLWTGSPSTGQFLSAVLPALASLSTTLEVLGATVPPPEGILTLHQRSWDLPGERAALTRARVGLYPIDRKHPLSEGKAGLKAVLYMAYGLPCVVSPTAAVAALVRDGQEGLHAHTDEDWRVAVERLLVDDQLWQAMSDRARLRAESLSLQTWGPRVARRLQALEPGSRSRGTRPDDDAAAL